MNDITAKLQKYSSFFIPINKVYTKIALFTFLSFKRNIAAMLKYCLITFFLFMILRQTCYSMQIELHQQCNIFKNNLRFEERMRN